MTPPYRIRKLALFAAPFGAAAVLCCAFSSAAAVCAVVCAAGLLLLLLLRKGKLPYLLPLLGGLAGGLWFLLWTALFVAPAGEWDGVTAETSGTVLSFPAKTSSGVSMEVELENGVTAKLHLRGECDAAPGDTVNFTADFVRSDFLYGDQNSYYSANGVFLLAYGDPETLTVLPGEPSLRFLPALLAERLKNVLDDLFTPSHAALLRAMILGDKSQLDGEVSSFFRRAGLSHVLVVSGLHLSVLLSALRLLLGGRRKPLAFTAFPLIVCFIFLVGGTPSVIRAGLMSLLPLAAPLLQREDDPPTTLSAALFLLILQNPYAAAGISLQLSFASVAGIMLFSEPLNQWLRERTLRDGTSLPERVANRALSFLWASFATSIGAMVFTVPISALYFGSISLIAPLSNLLCLWAVSLLVPAGLICALLGLVLPAAAGVAAHPIGFLCTFLLHAAQRLGSPALAALSLEGFYLKIWLAATCLLFAVTLLRRKKPRKLTLPLYISVILLCIALLFTFSSHYFVPLTVTVLDVGQGAATAFYSKASTALVDCGGSGPSNAGDVAADHFQQFGSSRLDLLVLTHLHDDHYNGVKRLFARMDVGAVILPSFDDGTGRREEVSRLAQEEGATLLFMDSITHATLGQAELTLYPPLGSGTTNEAGLFVLCSAGEFDVLITGDGDSAVESLLVSRYPIPDTELLLVGHYGAKSSTSEEFLAAVKPEYAVISAGYNSYGHPHPDVLARLDAAGAAIFRTDLNGSVTITVHPGALGAE